MIKPLAAAAVITLAFALQAMADTAQTPPTFVVNTVGRVERSLHRASVSSMSELAIPEGIVRLTHALVEDAALRSWFLRLEQVPDAVRRAALVQMAQQMTTAREDAELVAAVSALARADLYRAVRQAVGERCGR